MKKYENLTQLEKDLYTIAGTKTQELAAPELQKLPKETLGEAMAVAAQRVAMLGIELVLIDLGKLIQIENSLTL